MRFLPFLFHFMLYAVVSDVCLFVFSRQLIYFNSVYLLFLFRTSFDGLCFPSIIKLKL